MAADNRSITITLKLTGEESGGSNVDTSAQTNTSSFVGEDKNSTTKAFAKYAVGQVANVVTSEVIAWAEYYWNRELSLNDDYIGQRNKQIAMTQINRGIGFAGSIFASTVAGSSFGPGGAVIGALIGTATAIANVARSNLQGKLDQDISLNQMNAQLSFTRSRAGWSTNAASIGEDL